MENNIEIERIKNYVEKGPIGRFNFDNEIKFILSNRQVVEDMFSAGYITETKYLTEKMTLSARYLMLNCYRNEMFERFGG